jgi:hypothetical protein
MELLEGEGRASEVAGEALNTLAVLALDADGRIDVKPAGGLPRKHVLGDLLVQEAEGVEMCIKAGSESVQEGVGTKAHMPHRARGSGTRGAGALGCRSPVGWA